MSEIGNIEITKKTFNNDGLNISYFDIGSGNPVFLLHGFTLNAKSNWIDTGWVHLLLDAGRRVIALDARGHGDSDRPYDAKYYPSDVVMEDSITLMKLLNIQSADFIGYSMGARMATFAAIKYPNKINKLVMGGMGENIVLGLGDSKPIFDGLMADNIADITDIKARRFRRISQRQGNDLKAMAYCISSSRQKITLDNLKKITAKTLVIAGDKDEMSGNVFALKPYIKNAEAVEIKGCNHFNALTNDEFRSGAIAFILK